MAVKGKKWLPELVANQQERSEVNECGGCKS
jgi:hypothetical protein